PRTSPGSVPRARSDALKFAAASSDKANHEDPRSADDRRLPPPRHGGCHAYPAGCGAPTPSSPCTGGSDADCHLRLDVWALGAGGPRLPPVYLPLAFASAAETVGALPSRDRGDGERCTGIRPPPSERTVGEQPNQDGRRQRRVEEAEVRLGAENGARERAR